jgi:hypothetical protein
LCIPFDDDDDDNDEFALFDIACLVPTGTARECFRCTSEIVSVPLQILLSLLHPSSSTTLSPFSVGCILSTSPLKNVDVLEVQEEVDAVVVMLGAAETMSMTLHRINGYVIIVAMNLDIIPHANASDMVRLC